MRSCLIAAWVQTHTCMQQALVYGRTQLTDQVLLQCGVCQAVTHIMHCRQAVWVVDLHVHVTS
jgi:hypothetical protein